MSAMVKRVGAAIKAAIAAEMLEMGTVNSDRYTDIARAAIAAMREPTDDVSEIMSGHAANGYVDWRDLHAGMIDAALKE